PVDGWLQPDCPAPDGEDFVIEGANGPGENPRSPERGTAGASEPDWSYVTATFDGEETTTIWATDSLGARSRDAQLTARVGPGVDTPPECTLRSPDGLQVEAIAARQGKTRQLSVYCFDNEFDPLTTSVSVQPER